MTCEKHSVKPAWGYDECAGCEVERLRSELAVMEKLYKEACDAAYDRGELVAEIERLCGLIAGWVGKIEHAFKVWDSASSRNIRQVAQEMRESIKGEK